MFAAITPRYGGKSSVLRWQLNAIDCYGELSFAFFFFYQKLTQNLYLLNLYLVSLSLFYVRPNHRVMNENFIAQFEFLFPSATKLLGLQCKGIVRCSEWKESSISFWAWFSRRWEAKSWQNYRQNSRSISLAFVHCLSGIREGEPEQLKETENCEMILLYIFGIAIKVTKMVRQWLQTPFPPNCTKNISSHSSNVNDWHSVPPHILIKSLFNCSSKTI